VISELKQHPNTRQAIMTMYERTLDMRKWGGKERVPCSLTYQFLLRDDELVLIYNQRSCDFIKFFPADVYFTVKLLQHVAKKIEKPAGKFIHFLGSLHVFAKDVEGEHIF
jgi:thymidylate synthase